MNEKEFDSEFDVKAIDSYQEEWVRIKRKEWHGE
jgi:hypothetical protein